MQEIGGSGGRQMSVPGLGDDREAGRVDGGLDDGWAVG